MLPRLPKDSLCKTQIPHHLEDRSKRSCFFTHFVYQSAISSAYVVSFRSVKIYFRHTTFAVCRQIQITQLPAYKQLQLEDFSEFKKISRAFETKLQVDSAFLKVNSENSILFVSQVARAFTDFPQKSNRYQTPV